MDKKRAARQKKEGILFRHLLARFVWYRFYTFRIISIPFKIACSFIGINL